MESTGFANEGLELERGQGLELEQGMALSQLMELKLGGWDFGLGFRAWVGIQAAGTFGAFQLYWEEYLWCNLASKILILHQRY